MKININEILYAVSSGFDSVEKELLGTRPGHCKRIAAISILTGKALGLSENELIDLAAFSILHDNALTEVNQEEIEYKKYNNGVGYTPRDFDIRRCTLGENNTKYIPFRTNNRDVILLHHENADGSGPFGRTYDRTPIKAQIIHLADMIETQFNLNEINKETYGDIIYFLRSNVDTLFSRELVNTFTKFFKQRQLNSISITNLDNTLRKATKNFNDEYSFKEIINLAILFARIVDHKSHYTCRHSIGVAENARAMAKFYHFPQDKMTKYYLAAALHDIGKLMIPNEILQKPGALTDEEYMIMRGHAYSTYNILNNIKNMDDIKVWASHHHEKLNGTGYPFGLNEENLSFEEKLMTCCDIYQALTEERSYKAGLEHEVAIQIMRDMVIKGEIDMNIVNDIDRVMSNHITAYDQLTSILH